MKLSRWLFTVLAVITIQQGFPSPCCVPRECDPCCFPAYYTKAGNWFTRLRALYIYPIDSSGSVRPIPNSKASVHPAWTGEFDLGCMFTDNLGLEFILSTSKHSIWGQKSLSGTKIGTTWILPPTLLLHWRIFPTCEIQPYMGAGVNVTMFYSYKSSIQGGNLSLDNSWGGAIQAGADWFFYEDWLFNVDIKYIWIHTRADFSPDINAPVPFEGKVDIDLNPLVVGFGFGKKW